LDEHDRFVKRTELGALALAAAGGLVLALLGRWGWAAGFLLGCAAILGNFLLIVRGVRGLVAGPPGALARRRAGVGAALRFLIAAAVLVLAVVVLRVNVLALLAGLVLTQFGMIVYWLLASAHTENTPTAGPSDTSDGPRTP
jgi:ATP synthase I chain